MSTVERLEILKDMISEGKVSTVAYFRTDGGNTTLYTQEYVNEKDNVINDLLKRVSDLEFEVEKLEKNEQYKYINGQAYFRQDYVLGREKEIDRLNNIIEKLEQENTVLKTQVVNKDKYSYGIRM